MNENREQIIGQMLSRRMKMTRPESTTAYRDEFIPSAFNKTEIETERVYTIHNEANTDAAKSKRILLRDGMVLVSGADSLVNQYVFVEGSLDKAFFRKVVDGIFGERWAKTHQADKAQIYSTDLVAWLRSYDESDLQDGMTSEMGETILRVLRFNGSEAIKRLNELLVSNDISAGVMSHLLRWLGRIKDPTTSNARLDLLCKALRLESPVIREGGALGLSALQSSAAIPFLKEAIENEGLPALRADMQQVLAELEHPN